MKGPFYKLDKDTTHIILELIKKAQELELGMISFHYNEGIDFHITQYKNYWGLVIKQRWAKTADIYKILDGEIAYQYSESEN